VFGVRIGLLWTSILEFRVRLELGAGADIRDGDSRV